MDHYPQPRPVLYGTSDEEPTAQTQTAPVRTGPPSYPPAPPLAGDAPDPFGWRPKPFTGIDIRERGALPMALLYALASAYSLLQLILGTAGFANPATGRLLLSGEIGIGLIVTACLVWLSGREYLLALALVALHTSLGIVYMQWQSPAFWVSIAIMLYLLRPAMRRRYGRMARAEIRLFIARHRFRRPRHAKYQAKYIRRSHRDDRRITWMTGGSDRDK